MKTTTAPLAQRIAPARQVILTADQSAAHRELTEEAFNVTHETGRTPRQLADSRAELLALVTEFVMTHELEPTRTAPVMPMNTPLAQDLMHRARAAAGIPETPPLTFEDRVFVMQENSTGTITKVHPDGDFQVEFDDGEEGTYSLGELTRLTP